jgi:inorganic pyrophosphatase
MRAASSLRSPAPVEVYVQLPYTPDSSRKCNPNGESRPQRRGRACVRKHLPNHKCERSKSERSHRGTTGIEAHRETASNRRRDTGFLFFFTTSSITELLHGERLSALAHRHCQQRPIASLDPASDTAGVPKHSKRSAGFADPTRLPPFESKHADLTVIIETPKGSRNKYAYDPEERIFALRKVLPAGMAFPYDFGFVPSTLAGDGDPLDVLVLMDEPAFPGCKLTCRLVGVIEGEQGAKKKRERNDRIVAVESGNHSYAHIKRVDDLGKSFEREIEEFFVNYHRLIGKEYHILAVKGPAAAGRCVGEARKRAR